jgi:ketosteroid isomerase-like protein
MSKRNLEVVRAMWEPFKGLDATTIDWDAEEVRESIALPFSPDVELSWSTRWAGKREYRGRDGVIRAYREWVEPFSEYYAEPLDFIEVGEDFVVVPTRQWGVGEASGVPVETEVTHVFEFRDGQIARLDEYETVEEALKAAGKRE